MRSILVILILIFGISGCSGSPTKSSTALVKPNILLIIADDLGYSDIGPFGGEIPTPNLDQLAAHGTSFSNFHTSPSCSPTRAMLFTGVDHHLAGLGTLAEIMTPDQRGRPGYEGFLNDRVASIATVLKGSGYRTLFSGKWHLGRELSKLPISRGFDRDFSMLEGGGNHFDNRGFAAKYAVVGYRQDGKDVVLHREHYSSETIADKFLKFVAESTEPTTPFFGVLSFTAPHWPLQAPANTIERHEQKYLVGWDAIRRQRFDRQKEIGLISSGLAYPPRSGTVDSWEALGGDDQNRYARLMGIYAAMIEILDDNVGRVLNALRSSGQLNDTVVIFLSDNGPETRDISGYPFYAEWLNENFETRQPTGNADSFLFAGQGWGQVSATPNREGKASLAEGGVRTAMIVTDFRNQAAPTSTVRSFTTVLDIVPTILELVNDNQTTRFYADNHVYAPTGQSLWPAINGASTYVHAESEFLGFEYNGHASLVQGRWKALRPASTTSGTNWKLYDLEADQTEMNNLAGEYPGRLKAMIAAHERYAERVGVLPRAQSDARE